MQLSTGAYLEDSFEGFQPIVSSQSGVQEISNQSLEDRLFQSDEKYPTIAKAIDFTLTEKKSLKHFRDYDQKLNKFKNWIFERGLQGHSLAHFSHKYIRQFKLTLEEEGLYSNNQELFEYNWFDF